jgi:hypothetical protein
MGQEQPESTRDRPNAARRGETWKDHWQRRMKQGQHGDDAASGDRTKPPQPQGTTPLERDQRPINQSR